MIERPGNDLLQADEYLAGVGVRAIPEPPLQPHGQVRLPLQQCCIADCSGLSPMYESKNDLFAGGNDAGDEHIGVRSSWKDIRNDRNDRRGYRNHAGHRKRRREIRVRDRSGVDQRIGRTQSRLDCDRYVRDERDKSGNERRLRCDDKSGAVIEKDPARPGPSRIGSNALTSIVSRLLPPPRPLPARLYRPRHGCHAIPFSP